MRTVEKEIGRVLPAGFGPFAADPASAIEAKAERTIKPESIALAVFGGIAGLAALLIGAQLIGRQLRLDAEDLETLRALGADPTMTTGDGLIGIVGAVVIGALLAAGVAVALSPLSPLGPVRPVYPTPGIAFDWTVLALGVVVLVVALSALAIALSSRNAPHHAEQRARSTTTRPSGVTGVATSWGLPPTAVAGVRFALAPGG